MYPKFFIAALLASVASFAAASPNPVPTPAPEEPLQARQNAGQIFDSLTSAAASVITGDGGSVFTQATSVIGSAASEVTSFADSLVSKATSAASVVNNITSVAGQAGSIISGITGTASSTSTAQSSNNAALGLRAVGLSSPVAVGLITVMGSALLGAVITL